MTDSRPTHCIDCKHSVFGMGAHCSNPAALSLDAEDQAAYDDPMQPCPIFEAKPIVISGN